MNPNIIWFYKNGGRVEWLSIDKNYEATIAGKIRGSNLISIKIDGGTDIYSAILYLAIAIKESIERKQE